MPRKTRGAAAKAKDSPDAEQHDAILEEAIEKPLPPTPRKERGALRNITPNGPEVPASEEDMAPKGKKGKRGGKKKGKKGKADKVEDGIPAETEVGERDKEEDVPAVGGADESSEPLQEDVPIERPATPSVKTQRMTRRQKAEAEQAEDGLMVKGTGGTPKEPSEVVEDKEMHAKVEEQANPSQDGEQSEETVEPGPDESVEAIASTGTTEEANASTPSLENSEDLREEPPINQPLEQPNDSQQLNADTSIPSSPTQPEDPIEAIDALEDAIEEMGKVLPVLEVPLSPMKRSHSTKAVAGKPKTAGPSAPKTTGLKTVPRPRVDPTKSLLGRASSVRAAASPRLTNTTQPSAISPTRLAGLSSTTIDLIARSTRTKTRPTSVIAPASATQHIKEKKPDYLASKRRPMSLQFPTPPPPPRSTKPPTTSNFTLPSDALQAKFKAAKEERLKRQEQEAAKKREFKARPVPVTAKTKPVQVRQTAASRARLSVIGNLDTNSNQENQIADKALKRSSTVTANTSLSTKRNSMVGSTSKRSSVMGPPAPIQRAPATSMALKRSSTISDAQKAFSSSLSVSKRQSGVLPNTSARRISSMQSMGSSTNSVNSRTPSVSKPPVTAQDVAVQKQKGKDVFNRDRVDKESRERTRREKDEAMKKARAEASERGRQASREWAEKQKKALSAKSGLKQS